MAEEARKFSQFDEVTNPTGSEQIVGFSGSQNIRVPLDSVKSLVTKSDVGLGNADNTTDLNKPISTATQSALNGKSNINHQHAVSDVPGLQDDLNAKSDVGHQHAVSDVTGLQDDLNAKSDVGHQHAISDTVGLQTELNNKASTVHNHNMTDITGLSTALSVKSDVDHNHVANDITDLTTKVEEIVSGLGGVTQDVSFDNAEW